jgi:hypothetical protein
LFQTFAYAGGFYGYHLPDMHKVAEVAAPYYNNDLRGGEGHMEVGKLILNVVKKKATMTLSVKPFGCMPSSGVSDGVQSLITERFPGTIYCAVETSGDGAVNFQSRVQMYLFKAKQAAQAEFDRALAETGITLEQFQNYLAKSTLGQALHHPEHVGGTTTTDLVYEVAERINSTPIERAGKSLSKFGKSVGEGVMSTVQSLPSSSKKTWDFTRRAAVELFGIAKDRAPAVADQARERIASVLPFAKKDVTSEHVAVAAE